MTILPAVQAVLVQAGEPLHYKELTTRILKQKLWTTNGLTPHDTINSRLAVDIKERGIASIFQRTGKGMFALREWGLPEYQVPPSVKKSNQQDGKPTPESTEPLVTSRLSFTDAAEKVLEDYAGRKPMHYRAVSEKALELGLLTTSGKTPEATLYAQIITENQRRVRRGERPRFIQYGKGYVGLTKWAGAGLAFQVEQHNQQVRKKLRQRAWLSSIVNGTCCGLRRLHAPRRPTLGSPPNKRMHATADTHLVMLRRRAGRRVMRGVRTA